jgi:hypothetical protein
LLAKDISVEHAIKCLQRLEELFYGRAYMKLRAAAAAGREPWRVVVVGDTCVSEQGMAAIIGRDKRYHVCGGAHGFLDAGELIRKHQPEIMKTNM